MMSLVYAATLIADDGSQICKYDRCPEVVSHRVQQCDGL